MLATHWPMPLFFRFDPTKGLWKAKSTKSPSFLATTPTLLGRFFLWKMGQDILTKQIAPVTALLFQAQRVDVAQWKVLFFKTMFFPVFPRSVSSVEATPANPSFSLAVATTSLLVMTESAFPWTTGFYISIFPYFLALKTFSSRCDNIFHCQDGSDETKCSLLRNW